MQCAMCGTATDRHYPPPSTGLVGGCYTKFFLGFLWLLQTILDCASIVLGKADAIELVADGLGLLMR